MEKREMTQITNTSSVPGVIPTSLIEIKDYKRICPVAHQAPLSMGLPRQEYWSGLPFSVPGDFPYPGIEP